MDRTSVSEALPHVGASFLHRGVLVESRLRRLFCCGVNKTRTTEEVLQAENQAGKAWELER